MADVPRLAAGIPDLGGEAVGSAAICERLDYRLPLDRVMAYQFLEDGSGAVRAESVGAGYESFLGLHYPASDTEDGVRFLARLQQDERLRQISVAILTRMAYYRLRAVTLPPLGVKS
jgi:hypothetical protein